MDKDAQPSTFCPWQPKETPVIDHADRARWRQAVVYQVYTSSFADGFLPPDTVLWLGR